MSSIADDLFKKRNNPEYLNWLAVGDALITLNDGLQQYAERKMKDFHASLIKKLGGVKCNCSYMLGMKPNPCSNPHTSNCMWAKEIGNFHIIKKKKLLIRATAANGMIQLMVTGKLPRYSWRI